MIYICGHQNPVGLTLDPGDVGTIRIWIRNTGYLINNIQTTKLSLNPNLLLFTQFWKWVSSYVVVYKARSLPEPPTQATGLSGWTLRQGEKNQKLIKNYYFMCILITF